MVTALSPEKREDLVRWPPKGYDFASKLRLEERGDSGYEKDKARMQALYPELSAWDGTSIVRAWFQYGECTSWASTDLPTNRDEYFLAYLYLEQEIGVDHGGLDEFDAEWKAIGK